MTPEQLALTILLAGMPVMAYAGWLAGRHIRPGRHRGVPAIETAVGRVRTGQPLATEGTERMTREPELVRLYMEHIGGRA